MGRILVVARQCIEGARQRETRRQETEEHREARVMAQRQQREAKRRDFWLNRLKVAGAMVPGLPAEERFRRIAQALASKYKIQVKDLTPELRGAADAYLTHIREREIVRPSEFWLLNADRRRGSEVMEKMRTPLGGVMPHSLEPILHAPIGRMPAVFDFDPMRAASGAIGPVRPLRHHALQPHVP